MRVILFGATGMVGQGALRECLLDPGVDAVLTVGTAEAEYRKITHDIPAAAARESAQLASPATDP